MRTIEIKTLYVVSIYVYDTTYCMLVIAVRRPFFDFDQLSKMCAELVGSAYNSVECLLKNIFIIFALEKSVEL